LKVLLDESTPRGLRKFLPDHDVETVQEQGWTSMKNGALLRAAEDAGFEVMVTADSSIKYQQNLKDRKLALTVLPTNDIERLKPIIPQIVAMVDAATPGSYQSIDFSALGPRPVRRQRDPQL
jgi:hypothetical protein